MARPGLARQARRGKAWPGEARLGLAGQGRHGVARLGWAWIGKAGPGQARQARARLGQGPARHVLARQARLG
ncbi:MAG: hypothetical protein KatS3mg023_3055 [Armatimonadota bacterium]|nr:MAG: hypothetical protein KatS3mg023_3055 [Armatimonadota bacterium]